MKRNELKYLSDWKNRNNRRPLIIRGARQIGKTYLVRAFGKLEFENVIEYNFDLDSSKVEIFLKTDINEILNLISIDKGIKPISGKTLIFLDEIQAVPELIARLRYFYEFIPGLHIIAAGSLLDFALEDYKHSMPVGRIEYLFMGPMDFYEFLMAIGEEELLNYIKNYTLDMDLPIVIHKKCMKFLKHYFYVGGMPTAVNAYRNNDILSVALEHKIILQTFKDDFSKYKLNINSSLLKTVFEKIPQIVSERVKYVTISSTNKSNEVSNAIDLLSMARVLQTIYHSSSNASPLGAEINKKCFKTIFLDIGLMLSALEINLPDLELAEELLTVNSGALAEQFIGQHLLYRKKKYEEPSLYYWHRMKNGTTSEIDYIVDINSKIIPIEVKAGKTGSLKSLHVFIAKKKNKLAFRFNTDIPSFVDTVTAVAKTEKTSFKLISLPLYMVKELERLSGF